MDLTQIQKPVEDLIKKSNLIIKKNLKSNIGLVNSISDLTPILKGKKVRSTLLFLLSGLNNSISKDLPAIGASIEIFHLSSLIHDDIIDNSELRRGEKTLNFNVGNHLSVLWGYFLFINSMNIFNTINKKVVNDIIIKAARSMIEGQILEVENNLNFDLDMDTYFRIINKKTSSLFAGVTEITSVINDRSSKLSEAFYKFGLDFGTIFQMSDDMLDVFSDKSGKDRFRDLKEGRITFPFILLLKKNKVAVMKYFAEQNWKLLLDLFEKHRIKEKSLEIIDKISSECTDFINDFPDSKYKVSVINLLDFIRYREY